MKKEIKSDKAIAGGVDKLQRNKPPVAKKNKRVENKVTTDQALINSELRYRRLFETARDGLLILDEQTGIIEDVNSSLADMLGYERAEFLEKKLWEVGAFREVAAGKNAWKVLQEQGHVRYDNLPLWSKAGKLIRVEFIGDVYYVGDRKVIQCNVRDITDRTLEDEALRDSEYRYRSLFENILNGFAYCKMSFDMDRPVDFTYLEVNSAFETLTGLKDVVGRNVSEIVPGIRERDPELFELYGRVALTGNPERLETYVEALKDWYLVSVYSPRREYFVAIFDVITERKQAEGKLRASETRYKRLFEDSPISLWEEDYSAVKERLDLLRKEGITDLDEYFNSHPEAVKECASLIKVVDVNKATLKMFGADRKEDIYGNVSEIFKFEQIFEYKQELINIDSGNTRFEWEGINKTLDGRVINIELSWSVVPGYEDTFSRVIISLIDITARKQAEAALTRSEREYRTLFENMPIAMYRTSADGRILDANDAMVKMFGYKDRQALLAVNVIDLYLDPASDWKFKQEIEKTGVVFNFEAEFKRPDGTVFWTEDHNRVIRDGDGKILYYEGSLIDVTTRKQAEDVRTHLVAIVDASDDAIIGKTLDGIITSWNAGAQRLYGYTAEEAVGQPISMLIPPDHPDELPEILARLGRGERVDHYETVRVRKDGVRLDVSITVSPIRDASGKVIGASSIGRDITERKAVEENLWASEARYKGLFEDSPISLWEEDFSAVKMWLDGLRKDGVTDFRGYITSHPRLVAELTGLIKIVDVNKATLKLFGADRKEDLLKNLTDLFDIEHNHEFQDELIKIAEGGTNFRWEGRNRTLDGRWIDIDLNWSAAPGYERYLSRVIISMIDITQRKQVEDALNTAVTEYRHLFNTANDVIVIFEPENEIILEVNQAAVTTYGFSRDQLIGMSLKNLTKDVNRGEAHIKAMLESGSARNFESIHKNRDGMEIYFVINCSAIEYQGRKAVLSINHDITQRKQTEAKLQRQLDHIAALREIDRVIASSFDLHYNLTWILEAVVKELGADAADVMILNPVSSRLDFGSEIGFRSRTAEKALVQLGQSHAIRAVLDRQLIQIPDLKGQTIDPLSAKFLAEEGFVCYFGLPLMAKGSVRGVLEVFLRASLKPDQEWVDFLNTIAGQAALAIDNANLFDNLQRSNIDLTLAYDATIEGWSRAMDLRDKETEGHTLRVTELTMELAGLFGLKDEEMVGIRRGALLHDIGKMGVPDGILLKPGKLTEEEWQIMKKHPSLAFEMLSPIRYLQSAIDIPYCHHEKWDGTGYPRGLKGEQIPLPARIFSVIDVWDALTSDRPYRRAWPNAKVLEYLRSESGTSFDPEVVKICLGAGVFERQGRK
jgi:PAS domain S-box-containing protein/putative nucleotidyltransferase with HDIG domain